MGKSRRGSAVSHCRARRPPSLWFKNPDKTEYMDACSGHGHVCGCVMVRLVRDLRGL
jgi:hypothetical protein